MSAGLTVAVVSALCWASLLAGAGMDAPKMGLLPSAAAAYAAAMLVMWMVMMAAMMLPSAAPVILLHGTIVRKRRAGGGRSAGSAVFVSGYLLVWAGFSVAATVAQWALDQWRRLDATMAVEGVPLEAALLLAAGLYQLSPLKHACLRQCRSPLMFLARNWCDDAAGTFRLGLRHGLYCLGCCWALMALLFVGGVMNMLWIAGLTLLVLLEKVGPQGPAVRRLSGWALIAAAALLAAA